MSRCAVHTNSYNKKKNSSKSIPSVSDHGAVNNFSPYPIDSTSENIPWPVGTGVFVPAAGKTWLGDKPRCGGEKSKHVGSAPGAIYISFNISLQVRNTKPHCVVYTCLLSTPPTSSYLPFKTIRTEIVSSYTACSYQIYVLVLPMCKLLFYAIVYF